MISTKLFENSWRVYAFYENNIRIHWHIFISKSANSKHSEIQFLNNVTDLKLGNNL